MKSSIPYELIASFLSGNADAEQIEALASWRNDSQENESVFQDCSATWIESHPHFDVPEIDTNARWENFVQKTQDPTDPKPKIRMLQGWMRIAASLALLISIGGLLWFQNKATENIEFVSLVQKDSLSLPDESMVWVNESSKLVYPEKFKHDRNITFEGEGYFDIAPHPEKPFKITTPSVTVEVLGTEFNLRSYPGENQVEVVVYEGKVKVTALSTYGDSHVILIEGETGTYNLEENVWTRKSIIPANTLSWKTSELAFEDTRISTVLQELERHYNLSIETDNPSILDCHFTSIFKGAPLETILQTLAFSLNLQVEQQGSQYILKGTGCQK